MELYYYVDRDNLISVGAGVFALLNAGVEAFEASVSHIDHFIRVNSLVEYRGSIPKILMMSGLLREYPVKTVAECEEARMDAIEFAFGSLYFIRDMDPQVYYSDETDRFFSMFYVRKDFPLERLFDLIWSKFPDGIYLPRPKQNDASNLDTDEVNFLPLSTSGLVYLGDKPNLEEAAESLVKYRAANVSRSYLFCGAPGTGKTAFGICLGRKFTNKILKIDPAGLAVLDASVLEFVLEQLKPELLIFDDFDRGGHALEFMLFSMENLKQKYPKLLILATINNFDKLDKAMVRPGRFDHVLWFLPPDASDRKKIVKFYCEQSSLELTKEQLTQTVKLTDGMTGAFIKEICIRMAVEGVDRLESVAAEFQKLQDLGET